MVTRLWSKLSAACLGICGLLFVVMGVVLPIIIHEAVEAGLEDSWMHKDKYDHWGQIPGHYDMNVTRGFTIFNVSNPREVILGDKPRLVEIGPYPFREISRFVNWEYLDDNFNSRGQDVYSTQHEDKYIAFNYHLNLSYQYDTPTPFPLNISVTGMNGVSTTQPAYATFYGLTRAAFPSYSMQHLHDVVKSLEDDMFYLVYSYTIYTRFLSEPGVLLQYLQSLGFENPALINSLMTDAMYGLQTWKTLKLWIIAAFEENWSDGAMDILSNHFQATTPPLHYIINSTSVLGELIQGISADMLRRYGTNTPTGLRNVQWSTVAVTLNMPLDSGTVLFNKTLPSYLGLNTTYNFIPEIGAVMLGAGIHCHPFLTISDHLLAANYSYPMTNYQSLLNLNNIASLFTWYANENFTSIVST